MDSWKKHALVSLENDLKVNLGMTDLVGRLERPAGGFMTELERKRVEEIEGGSERVGRIISILRGKGNKEFDTFLKILNESGNEVWADKIQESARQFEEYHKANDQSGLKAIEYPMEGGGNVSLQLSQGSQVQVQGEGETRVVYVPVQVMKRKRSRSSASSGDNPCCPAEKRTMDEYMKMKMDLERQDVKSVHTQCDRAIRLFYSNALSRIERLLEPHLQAVKYAAERYLQLDLHEGEESVKLCDIQSIESINELFKLSVIAKWKSTCFLQQAVDAIPAKAREREVAEAILSHYDLHLAIYEKATLLKDDLAKEKESESEDEGKLVPIELTSLKSLAEFTCDDCHRLQIRILSQAFGIPAEKIICLNAAETQSTTVTFLIPNGFTYTIMQRITQLETVWVFLELDVIEVAISGFTFKPTIGCFLTLLRESKPFTADLLGVTEILPYQMHCLVHPGTKEPLSGRPLGTKWIAHQRKPLEDVVPEDNQLDAGRESEDEQTHTASEPKIKDLGRKEANLVMDNVSLTTKLKGSHTVETEQKKGISNLEERLVLAVKAQETQELPLLTTEKPHVVYERMLETAASVQIVQDDDGGDVSNELTDQTSTIKSQPKESEPSKRTHRHRWWLKVSDESHEVALPPSSPIEQPAASVEMKGEVVFRKDPKSNLMKSVSGTEWMYRRGALEGGRQAVSTAHRLHRFTRCHQHWLADHVHKEEEESCKQWLLHQSPEMTTVREAEEYRPGRVRHRYTTGVGMPAEVQSEWVLYQQLPKIEDSIHHGDLAAVMESIRGGFDQTDWQINSSLLIAAIEKGYKDIALALLAAQRLNVGDLFTALDMAHDKGMDKVAEEIIHQLMFIVEAGAICKGLSQEQNNRLFQLACHKGDVFAVQNILKIGCKLSILSREERVMLLLQACSEGNLIVVDTLIIDGCDVNCSDFRRSTPLMISVRKGHEQVVKALILAGAAVEMQDSSGFTALHYAATHNHIHCGILLAEGGASLRTKNNSSQTPLDVATAEFKEVIKQALSFTTRKTLCVIGNAQSGKSTLIAALQAEKSSLIGKIFNRIRRVADHGTRTAGIELIPHFSQRYGEVLFFDFAGQHEYHVPNQMFLELLLSKPGVSMTLLLVVKATKEEEAILHDLHRWLFPVALMATTTNPPRVIVIGSFLDKVKSKYEAISKLTRGIEATRKDLKDLPLVIVGVCCLNCRQPLSSGIDQLTRFLQDVPIPEFKASHTQYSLAWVLSQIRSSFKDQAVQLQELSKWIQDNKDNLPQLMPPPVEVCQDLSAAGHALYLPNKEDPHKGWLVLDLPSILRDVYGTLFSHSNDITNEVGLVHRQHLASLFPDLDVELVQQLLVGLESCIPVDPAALKMEVSKLTQSVDARGWLFFPALIPVKPPQPRSEDFPQQNAQNLCWQLKISKKHLISARVIQIILLRLAAHFVVKQHDVEGVQRHCCSIWWNGISWQSKNGVDVSVHITNRVIRVVSASDISADKSYRYLSDVISDILSVILQLSPNLAAAAYIVHPWKMATLHKDAIAPSPPEELFLVEDIWNAITDHEDYTLSCKDSIGHSTRLLVSDLFGGWSPSLEDIERILWTQPKPTPTAAATDSPLTPTAAATDQPLIPTASSVDPLSAPYSPLQLSLIPRGAQALLDTSAVPTLDDVNELIAIQVAAKWQNLAIKLGVEDFLIDVISEDHPRSCVAACQDMLKHWLREEPHTGGEERTWSTLLTALGRADFGELERSLWREHFRH